MALTLRVPAFREGTTETINPNFTFSEDHFEAESMNISPTLGCDCAAFCL